MATQTKGNGKGSAKGAGSKGNGTKRAYRKTGEPLPTQLNTKRVLAVLAQLGVTEADFTKRYDAIPTARKGSEKTATPEMVKAVEEFVKTGDFDAFMRTTKIKSQDTANKWVRRVLSAKAKAA